jgi:hypothetical protein
MKNEDLIDSTKVSKKISAEDVFDELVSMSEIKKAYMTFM